MTVASGVALATASVSGGSSSVAVTVGLAVTVVSVGLAVGDGCVAVNSLSPTTVSRITVSVKFAGAIRVASSTSVAVAKAAVASSVALATASVGGGSSSVAVTVGLAVAAIPVGLAVGDGCVAVNSLSPTTVSRITVSVKFAGAIRGASSTSVAVAKPSVASGVALATASVGGGSSSVAVTVGLAVASGVALAIASVGGGSSSVAVNVGLTVAAIPVGLVVGEGLVVATGRRPTTVSRMAVSVKFAGAISVGTVVALTTASVGGGASSVAVTVGLTVATIPSDLPSATDVSQLTPLAQRRSRGWQSASHSPGRFVSRLSLQSPSLKHPSARSSRSQQLPSVAAQVLSRLLLLDRRHDSRRTCRRERTCRS